MELQELRDKSEKLYALRREIDKRDQEHRMVMEPLEQERDALQGEVLAALNELQLASFKVASGETFTKAVRKSIVILDPYRALEWAKEHGAVSVDSKLVAQMYKDGKQLPEAFQPRETEYISVRKPKADTTNQTT